MGPKAKNQKMSLGDFLTDETLGSWADEMDDMPISSSTRTGYGGGDRERRPFNNTANFEPSGYSYPPREQLPLPDKPPYTAHIGNLSFDATEASVRELFEGCEVTSVRIVEDRMDGKPKGFGYVEFASLDGLKKALDFNGASLNGRNIRTSVAEPPKDRQDSSRDFSDWSRKGPLPDLPGQRRSSERGGGGYGSRGFDNTSDAGGERSGRRGSHFDQGDGKVRDFGNWERKGPLAPMSPTGGPVREGGRQRLGEAPRERRRSPAWGEGQSQDGSRPPRREYQEKPQYERQPTAPELDNQWRSKMRPDAPAKSPTPTRDPSTPPSPAAPAAPATRPKLNLQKRTVSEAEPTPPPTGTDSKASPFGGARPIDTFTREKEIEEKRQVALRLKKEQDDKVREEKRLAKEAAKAEKAAAAAAAEKEKTENGTDGSKPGLNYEILRRTGEEEGAEADEDGEAGKNANQEVAANDQAVKPKEVTTELTGKSEGSWRKGPGEQKSTATTAETLEEDGWSTVSKPSRNRRGGNQAGRAIAS